MPTSTVRFPEIRISCCGIRLQTSNLCRQKGKIQTRKTQIIAYAIPEAHTVMCWRCFRSNHKWIIRKLLNSTNSHELIKMISKLYKKSDWFPRLFWLSIIIIDINTVSFRVKQFSGNDFKINHTKHGLFITQNYGKIRKRTQKR